METRSLNTLYKLLWEPIKDCEIFCLCGRMEHMFNHKIIDIQELYKLKEDLYKFKPIKTHGVYWWGLNKACIKLRKNLVQRRIKETEMTDTNAGKFKIE